MTLDGRDLREYRQEDVRRAIAVAGQDSHLFSASIRENVRLARPEAGDAEIEHALRPRAALATGSGLPDGLDTLVGEEGRELSGGQRQRLVLARALLADAPCSCSTSRPRTSTRRPRSGCSGPPRRRRRPSVLLITHRPEGLDLVDEVVDLGEGRGCSS